MLVKLGDRKMCPQPPEKLLHVYFMLLVIPPSYYSRHSLKGEEKHFKNSFLSLSLQLSL